MNIPPPPMVCWMLDDGGIRHEGMKFGEPEPINALCRSLRARGFDENVGLVVLREINGHPRGYVDVLRLKRIGDV